MANARTREVDPAIIAAGYLAKRTRGMGRWKKRWWQLSDDGTLLYFKSEERAKALGEIDVARSCYEVKLGGEQCRVEFPRIIHPRCCFSFSVLKRTYYLYAATPSDAKHWAESIESVSVVLNYRKKTNCKPEPYLQPVSSPPSEKTQQNNPSQFDESRRYSVPHRPHASASNGASQRLSPATELEATDQPTPLPQINKPAADKGPIYSNVQELPETRYGSVPDLHSGYKPPQRFHANPHGHRYLSHPTHSRMWLDGSPPPDAYMMGRKYLTNPRERRAYSASQTPHTSYHTGSLDRLRLNQRSGGVRARAHHAGREEQPLQELRAHRPVDMDGYALPPRPQSVDISEKRAHFTTPKFGVPILPFFSGDSDRLTSSVSTSAIRSGTAPPAVKPKPILKKTNYSYTPTLPPDDSAGNGKGGGTVSLSPPDDIPPEIPPKRCSVKVQVDSLSGQRDVFLPPPPDFKPPPPPGTSGGTHSTSDSKITPSHTVSSQPNTQNGLQQHRSQQSNASSYLQELSMAIKSVGVHQRDGSVCTTFRKLQRETESLFPDFVGTLMAAKRYHIVSYEGTRLIEGRDDGVLITLHRDVR